MPTFTMTLGELLEIPQWEEEWKTLLAGYPLFSSDYREHLNLVIEEHYLNREIGTETVDQFVFHVQRLMRRKMPLINKIYLQTIREIDPLVTQDIVMSNESRSKSSTESEGEGKTKTTGTNSSRAVASNNPQVRLAGNADYASGMSDSTAKADSDADTTEKAKADTFGDSESESRTRGYAGAPGDLLSSYYDSLINVDEMVLDFLAPCFMQIHATNQPFTIGRHI